MKTPRIFKQYRLTQAWAFKHIVRTAGINIYVDVEAVDLNFWITPDLANPTKRLPGWSSSTRRCHGT